MTWNESITDANDYPTSPTGMEKMAASCMLIEPIGEGVKKIDKIAQDSLPGKVQRHNGNKSWDFETISHMGISIWMSTSSSMW